MGTTWVEGRTPTTNVTNDTKCGIECGIGHRSPVNRLNIVLEVNRTAYTLYRGWVESYLGSIYVGHPAFHRSTNGRGMYLSKYHCNVENRSVLHSQGPTANEWPPSSIKCNGNGGAVTTEWGPGPRKWMGRGWGAHQKCPSVRASIVYECGPTEGDPEWIIGRGSRMVVGAFPMGIAFHFRMVSTTGNGGISPSNGRDKWDRMNNTRSSTGNGGAYRMGMSTMTSNTRGMGFASIIVINEWSAYRHLRRIEYRFIESYFNVNVINTDVNAE